MRAAGRARLKVRAKHLDLRPQGGGALAVVMDANAEQVLPVLVDWQAGTLAAQPPFPAPPFGIEAACLYRDAQQIDHLFVVGKDGQAEQWLMHGDQRRWYASWRCRRTPGTAALTMRRTGCWSTRTRWAGGRTTPMPKVCLSASC
jgi:hypothetical protein